MLQERKVIYQESSYQIEDLITLAEAADQLSMTIPGVASLILRGTLTEIINPAKPVHQGRRMVPRVQVVSLALSR